MPEEGGPLLGLQEWMLDPTTLVHTAPPTAVTLSSWAPGGCLGCTGHWEPHPSPTPLPRPGPWDVSTTLPLSWPSGPLGGGQARSGPGSPRVPSGGLCGPACRWPGGLHVTSHVQDLNKQLTAAHCVVSANTDANPQRDADARHLRDEERELLAAGSYACQYSDGAGEAFTECLTRIKAQQAWAGRELAQPEKRAGPENPQVRSHSG